MLILKTGILCIDELNIVNDKSYDVRLKVKAYNIFII